MTALMGVNTDAYVTGNISDITHKCLRSWFDPWQNYKKILELNGDNVFCIII